MLFNINLCTYTIFRINFCLIIFLKISDFNILHFRSQRTGNNIVTAEGVEDIKKEINKLKSERDKLLATNKA